MKNSNKKGIKGGISLIGVLILGFVLILALSYYKISIKSVVESPTAKENINYVGGASKNLWNDYLKKPADYFWNKIVVNLLWKSFVNNMERIRDGKPTELEEAAQTINIGTKIKNVE